MASDQKTPTHQFRDIEFLQSTVRKNVFPETAGLPKNMHGIVKTIIEADLKRKNEKLEMEQLKQKEAQPMIAPNIKSLLLFAADVELETLHSMLGKAGKSKAMPIAGQVGQFFELSDGEVRFPVGFYQASQQGKDEMKNLLHQVRELHKPTCIILAGMMGGIVKKTKILDVMIPQVIYDVRTGTGTGTGTENPPPVAVNEDSPRNFGPDVFDYVTNNKNGPQYVDRWSFRVPSTGKVRRLQEKIRINTRKFTLCVPAKWDNMGHEIVKCTLAGKEEHISGMEMEGWAIADAARPTARQALVQMAMIKGVADYGGPKPEPDEAKRICELLGHKYTPEQIDPTLNKVLKVELQRLATRRSLIVAFDVIKHFNRVGRALP